MSNFCKFFGLGILMGLAACSNNPEPFEPSTEGQQEIKLMSSITPATRGANLYEQDQIINANQQVGVTITGASREHQNVPWTSNGMGALENSGNPIYFSGQNTATISAYQPYDPYWADVVNNSYNFYVDTDQSASIANSDLLWATATADVSNPMVMLNFHHMMAKVNVTLTIEDGTEMTNGSITLEDLELSVDFQNGVLTRNTENRGNVLASTGSTQGSAIVAPQIVPAGVPFISVTVDNNSYFYFTNTTFALESGKSSNFNLRLTTQGELVMSTANITEWETEDVDLESANILQEYMYFKAFEDGVTVGINNNNNYPDLSYSMNKQDWYAWDYSTISLQKGDVLYMKGNNPNGFSHAYEEGYEKVYYTSKFTTTGKVAVDGNIMSLLYGDNFVGEITIPNSDCFSGAFMNTSIITAPRLPATNLTDGCYSGMFCSCLDLLTCPSLPATTLAYGCYSSMFQGCNNLTNPAQLPATELADYCYASMYSQCKNLLAAPDLWATTLAPHCYQCMFLMCDNLVIAPTILPAETLPDGCYAGMFNTCPNLMNAPYIMGVSLGDRSCEAMFTGCSSLTHVQEVLPAMSLDFMCYSAMFYGCTNLENAPELPATELVSGCYNLMFKDCPKISSVKVAYTDDLQPYTLEWLNGSADNGTIYKKPEASWNGSESWIPDGWTVVNY